MRILMLTHRVPYPPDKGDRIRSYNIIKFLAREHSISLMSVSREPVHPKSYQVLKQYCDSVEIVEINSKLSTVRSGFHLFTKSPLTLPAFYSRRFQKAVQAKLQNTRFDLIYIYSSSMAQYVLDAQSKGVGDRVLGVGEICSRVTAEALSPFHTLHAKPCTLSLIMDFIDVDSQKWFDYAAMSRQPMKAVYRREGFRLRAFEKRVASRCELNLFTSESELNLFKEYAPDAAAMALPNGVDLTGEPISFYKPNKLVFVGSMDYWPNIDAMIYFTGEILPLIEKDIPDVELFIVGRNPSTQVKTLERLKNVTVTGDVKEVGTYLQDAAASVIPLRIARGMQNKILEAMAHGVPVITTSAALDGIGAEVGSDVLVADTAREFARRTLSVLVDKSLRNQLAVNGRALVEQKYRWEGTLQKLEETIASVQNLRDLRALRGENAFESETTHMQAVQKELRCEAHEVSTSEDVQGEYGEARRSSGTTQVRPFQQPEKPFVSFIIPAKNEAKMIGQCLDSIINLAYDPARYECIVVDNGSIDDTAEIAEKKGARVIRMFNATISQLRNRAAQNAKGDFLGFIDADCVLDREWLKKALRHFEDSVVGCVGSYTKIPEDSSWMEKAWTVQNKTRTVEDVAWLPSRSILVRKEAFKHVGGFNESLITCEDVDLCYRLRQANSRIISDNQLISVHFGEAKTLTDFFRKERWRGQSNFFGLFSHGFCFQEIPSLVFPVFYLLALAGLPISVIQSIVSYSPTFVLVNLGCILFPPMLLALRRTIRADEFSCLGQLTFLYFTSLLARSSALLPLKQDDGHRDAYLRREAD